MPSPPCVPTQVIRQIAGLGVAILFCQLGRSATYVLAPRQTPVYHAFTILSWVCAAALVFVVVKWTIKGRADARQRKRDSVRRR
jgi:hypothetical protein